MKNILSQIKVFFLIFKGLEKQDRFGMNKNPSSKIFLYIVVAPFLVLVFFILKIKNLSKDYFVKKMAGKQTEEQKKIIEKYKGKILGSRYNNDKFYVDDFLDLKKLFNNIIPEFESRESDMTKNGFNFIKEYYGIDEFAKLLYKNDPDFPGKSIEENRNWIVTFENTLYEE